MNSTFARPARKTAIGGFLWALLLGSLALSGQAQAEPTSDKLSIVSLRPYGGGIAYVQVSSDTFCTTDTFTIDLTQPSGKEMYAAVLAALTGGKKIRIEASNATGCNGWATRLQSVFLYP